MLTEAGKHEELIFEKPIYVTGARRRKREFPERHINIPPIVPPPKGTDPGYYEWLLKYADFSVHVSNFFRAKDMEKKMWDAYKSNKLEEASRIFEEELSPIRVIPFDERTPQERWAHIMVQLPGDIGGPNRAKIKAILSGKCFGKVLEAMCGFNSYLSPSDNRNVTALDFCREALELYRYPKRTRILFDLNKIDCKRKMKFFADGEFDAITICFGFQYLIHPAFVFKELKRLLKPGGRLYLVENPRQHYEQMVYRPFSVQSCFSYLKKASFERINADEIDIAEEWEIKRGGRYYLIEAIKS